MANENKLKHLEFIQAVIARMNENSCHIKTWCVTILAALGAMYNLKPSIFIIVMACAIVVIFWSLDAYYLSLERKFKRMYHDVATKKESEINFSMREWHYQSSYWQAVFSKAARRFYLSLLILLILTGACILLYPYFSK